MSDFRFEFYIARIYRCFPLNIAVKFKTRLLLESILGDGADA